MHLTSSHPLPLHELSICTPLTELTLKFKKVNLKLWRRKETVGAPKLYAGAAKLYAGAAKLYAGAAKLYAGAAKLSKVRHTSATKATSECGALMWVMWCPGWERRVNKRVSYLVRDGGDVSHALDVRGELVDLLHQVLNHLHMTLGTRKHARSALSSTSPEATGGGHGIIEYCLHLLSLPCERQL